MHFTACMQQSKGVRFATFLVRTDALVALSINYTDLSNLINSSSSGGVPLVSIIAFRQAYILSLWTVQGNKPEPVTASKLGPVAARLWLSCIS